MIKSNVRSYELVKAINESSLTLAGTHNTSTKAGILTGLLTSALLDSAETRAGIDGTATTANINRQDIINASVEYVSTRVCVYLDEEGRIRFYQDYLRDIVDRVEVSFATHFEDTSTVNDSFDFIEFIKTLEDEIITVLDEYSSSADKLLLDNVEYTDSSDLDFTKNESDTVVSSETTSVDFNRPVNDIQNQTDSTALDFGTGSQDSFSTTDGSAISFDKSTQDSQSTTDEFFRTVEYQRIYAEFVNQVDSLSGISFSDEEAESVAFDPFGVDDDPAFDLQKAPIDLTVGLLDDHSAEFTKPQTDAVTLVDIESFEIEKPQSDSLGFSETREFALNKFRDDYVSAYDEVTTLIEWNRYFDDSAIGIDVYSALFEMGQLDDDQQSDDSFDRTVEYNRDFADTQIISDAISSVSFSDQESDAVVTDPFGIDDDPAFDLQKAPIDSSVTNSDLSILAIEKVSEDNLNQYDDIVGFGINKSLDDLENISDLANIEFSTSSSDIYSVDDEYSAIVEYDRAFSEFLDYLENTVLSNTKSLQDTQEQTDSKSFDFIRPDLADSYTTNDSFDRTVDYSRTQDDSVTAVDSLSGISFSDEESESVAFDPLGVDDDPAFDLQKPAGDSLTILDASTLDNTLPKQDSQSQTDSLSTLNLDKSLQDNQAQSDTNSFDFVAGTKLDIQAVADFFDRTSIFSRIYQDNQAQSDTNSFTFTKGTISESLIESDSQIIQSYKYLYESMSETDSGTLLNTDYVGSYYFNDDFVGSKRTF